MCNLELKIDLKSLEPGSKVIDFKLDNEYFEAIDAPDIRQGNLTATISIRKMADSFELNFHIQGFVVVTCDLCLDDMEQFIETENRIFVKFGEEYSEEDDLIIIPKDEGIVDISWLIYEFIELSIPIRHVHTPGKCNPAMTEMLKEHLATRSSNENEKQPIDPRWAELEKLKTTI